MSCTALLRSISKSCAVPSTPETAIASGCRLSAASLPACWLGPALLLSSRGPPLLGLACADAAGRSEDATGAAAAARDAAAGTDDAGDVDSGAGGAGAEVVDGGTRCLGAFGGGGGTVSAPGSASSPVPQSPVSQAASAFDFCSGAAASSFDLSSRLVPPSFILLQRAKE
jgi:hypothetical protein